MDEPAAPGYSSPSRASVYALAKPDSEPLPKCTRMLVEFDGDAFAETDVLGSGDTVRVGRVSRDLKRAPLSTDNRPSR